jgi:glutaredoxin-related protein
MGKELKLFGADWCPKTAVIRNYLQSEWVDFEFYNVELDESAAEEVKGFYNGQLKFPTVSFGEDFLKNPKIPEIRAFVKKHGLDDG